MIHNLNAIVICHIGNDQVKGGGLNRLEMCSKLIHNLFVLTMESTEKQHHQEDGQYSHLATGQFKSKAVEAGTILDDGLGVGLDIVE